MQILSNRDHFITGGHVSIILFVGTDTDMTDITGRLLKRNGFNVQCAIGMEEAMTVIRKQQIAVVVADLEVSGDDMKQFCHRVKECRKSVRLLFISESEDDEVPILIAGADDWIRKPYHMKILYTRINVLLRQE